MSPQRIIGIAVLVVGVALLVVGLNASHSVVDQASDFWLGRFTHDTTLYIIGGIGVGALGVAMAVFAGRKSNA